jgi:gamma-glutamylcyclotransferase (GGCT)/AIG2-like uncharacterized protein YtfP
MKFELRVFVYGTLKKGFCNHDEYCAGVARIGKAWRRGRLFKLTGLIPAMTVPEEDVLMFGTANPAADIEAQERFETGLRSRGAPVRAPSAGTEWRTVRGELLTFDDAESRLPFLDSLEGFRPGRPSEYLRVLVYVNLPGDMQTSAWTYIAGSDPKGLDEYAEENWDSLTAS